MSEDESNSIIQNLVNFGPLTKNSVKPAIFGF